MNEQLQMVRDFHTAFNYNQKPHGCEEVEVPIDKVVYARMSFLSEELAEILLNLASGNREKQLDGAVDLAYFALGTLAIVGKGVYVPAGGYALVTDTNIAGKEIHLRTMIDAVNKTLFLMTFLSSDPEARKDLDKGLSYIVHTCVSFAEERIKADFYGAFAEVQRSNMSKLGADGKPLYNEAGKIQKGPGYSEPNLLPFLHDLA